MKSVFKKYLLKEDEANSDLNLQIQIFLGVGTDLISVAVFTCMQPSMPLVRVCPVRILAQLRAPLLPRGTPAFALGF